MKCERDFYRSCLSVSQLFLCPRYNPLYGINHISHHVFSQNHMCMVFQFLCHKSLGFCYCLNNSPMYSRGVQQTNVFFFMQICKTFVHKPSVACHEFRSEELQLWEQPSSILYRSCFLRVCEINL